jgi:GTP-binding protein
VVIAGRPNVGKSTLFNRLLGRRRAITDAEPGVTRDVLSEPWLCGGREALLSDTGGVSDEGDEFHELVSARALGAVEQASCILLVVDVTEITGEDQELMERLRPHRDKTVLVANKADNENREIQAYELYEYGFEEIVPISAEHARGIETLLETIGKHLDAGSSEAPDAQAPDAPDARVGSPATAEGGRAARAAADAQSERGETTTSGAEPGAEPDADPGAEPDAAERPIRIAVLGKPNTGKSTLANALTDHDYSIVSELPGTTRDVIAAEFSVKGTTYQLLDTAGMRRKSRVSEGVEYYSVNRAVRALEECDVVYLMIDAPEGVTEQDKKIARLAVDRGRAVIIVMNKWDLVSNIGNIFNAIADRTRHMFPVLSFAPIVAVSARERTGFPKLLKTTRSAFRQLNRRVETGPLNRALERWVDETQPPMVGNRRLKLRYITQVQANPVVFLLFANRVQGFPESYLSYIKNRIRAEFGFPDIPFRLEVRHQARS